MWSPPIKYLNTSQNKRSPLKCAFPKIFSNRSWPHHKLSIWLRISNAESYDGTNSCCRYIRGGLGELHFQRFRLSIGGAVEFHSSLEQQWKLKVKGRHLRRTHFAYNILVLREIKIEGRVSRRTKTIFLYLIYIYLFIYLHFTLVPKHKL